MRPWVQNGLTLNLTKSIAGMWQCDTMWRYPSIYQYTILLSAGLFFLRVLFHILRHFCSGRIPAEFLQKVWHCPAHCPSSQQRKATPCHSEHGASRCLSVWVRGLPRSPMENHVLIAKISSFIDAASTRRLLFIRGRQRNIRDFNT